MNRRTLLKYSSLSIAAFGLSRDIFAAEVMPASEDSIKLSSNENPHGPSPMARKAMADAIKSSNRYQWELTSAFRTRLGEMFGLSERNILVGAGSSELLGLACVLAASQPGNVVAPYPTFRLWMEAAANLGLLTQSVPVTPQKETDLQGMLAAINSNTRMVYLCNPNNPTGLPIPNADLIDFIQKVPPHIWVLLDEAYTEFENTPSLVDKISAFPNLIIAKTFSKIYGMAGCRVGYAVAQEQTIQKMASLQPWANASTGAVSVAGALASLEDVDFLRFVRSENAKCRKRFCDTLDQLGLPYVPSATSFVYFDAGSYPRNLVEHLRAHQIVGARTFEEGTSWLRLSIGNAAEMQRVHQVLTSL